jgi:ABC-type oligopeptide transport system ATPase subunit
MEAAVLELRSRVQKLEEENQLSTTLAYRLNHEFNTVQRQLNATMYQQHTLKAELQTEIEYSKF